ncbi:YkgJ family cysteine cluster protein [Halovivax cerinus]|uniref:YkgJ family cysteine cluster protein n=1 Tax=Halovivax cerinus TaxID=1487865 RepID=A0ABD5NJZ1_9EURY|nr:YkgJ family cysteine cluster protein [Halovivax cerinus]
MAVDDLADAIQSIGFDCTHCGACCRAEPGVSTDGESGVADESVDAGDDRTTNDETIEPHTATVFPDEIRTLRDRLERSDDDVAWRDVARPTPFGLESDSDGSQTGETFEWALQTDACGDCTFYDPDGESGGCTVHEDRPLICRTYPFSVALDGTSQPLGDPVDDEGIVRAHECEGLGRPIARSDAESMAATLKRRAIRELEEAIAVIDSYEPIDRDVDGPIVHDSDGPKHSDGRPLER